MKILKKVFVAICLMPVLASAQQLDCTSSTSNSIQSQVESLSVALANASWTHNDLYEGQVIVFSAKVHAHGEVSDDVDENGYRTQFYIASAETEIQIGTNGIEHTYLNVSAITKEKVKELERDGRFHLVEKGIELGNIQVSRDLPLAQAAYVEFEPVKIYGTIGISPGQNSNWEFLARVSASLGYAHGRSTKPNVDNTNNFYVGQDYGLSLKHRNFGQLDFDRGVDGELTKYNPDSTASREAYVRLGYTYSFDERSSITFSGEKRSFRFGPDYEKSRRYMLRYQRRF